MYIVSRSLIHFLFQLLGVGRMRPLHAGITKSSPTKMVMVDWQNRNVNSYSTKQVVSLGLHLMKNPPCKEVGRSSSAHTHKKRYVSTRRLCWCQLLRWNSQWSLTTQMRPQILSPGSASVIHKLLWLLCLHFCRCSCRKNISMQRMGRDIFHNWKITISTCCLRLSIPFINHFIVTNISPTSHASSCLFSIQYVYHSHEYMVENMHYRTAKNFGEHYIWWISDQNALANFKFGNCECFCTQW